MARPLILLALLPALLTALLTATPAAARDTIGIYGGWGAFRERAPLHCFAIAEPVTGGGRSGWRPFLAIGHWPGRGLRGQVQVRLSRARQPEAPVVLAIGDRGTRLVTAATDATGAIGADGWAASPRIDAAIVAAIRSGTSLSVQSRDRAGRLFADGYRLRGAASAIDAAALGCARRR